MTCHKLMAKPSSLVLQGKRAIVTEKAYAQSAHTPSERLCEIPARKSVSLDGIAYNLSRGRTKKSRASCLTFHWEGVQMLASR